MSFYLTWPNDSSLSYYPDNKIFHFTKHFPKPIELLGSWEVGLSEFFFPHTFYNINDSNYSFAYDLGENKIYDGEIKPGYYSSVRDILKAFRIDAFDNLIGFAFNHTSNCIHVSINYGARFMFKEGVAKLMGFY